MKLKAMLAALLAAGFAASFALADGGTPAATTSGSTSTSTTTSTTTTGKGKGDDEKKADKPKCQKVELHGSNASGTVSLTVDKASKKGAALVGKTATLTVAAGSALQATACLDAAGNLTLRQLEVSGKG